MIVSYIIGIIMFVLQVYILEHTHSVKLVGKRFNVAYMNRMVPLNVPLYIILLMLLATVIPYVWVVSTIIFWVVWLKRCSDPDSVFDYETYTYWRLRDNFLMKSI